MKQIHITPYPKTIFLTKGLVCTAPKLKTATYTPLVLAKTSSALVKTVLSTTFLSNSTEYGFAFNGKEKDDETYGDGNEYDYGFRIYNPRLGKFLSVDPLFSEFPWNSTYAFAENDVIRAIDLEGLEKWIIHDEPTPDGVIKRSFDYNPNRPAADGNDYVYIDLNGNIIKTKEIPTTLGDQEIIKLKEKEFEQSQKKSHYTWTGYKIIRPKVQVEKRSDIDAKTEKPKALSSKKLNKKSEESKSARKGSTGKKEQLIVRVRYQSPNKESEKEKAEIQKQFETKDKEKILKETGADNAEIVSIDWENSSSDKAKVQAYGGPVKK